MRMATQVLKSAVDGEMAALWGLVLADHVHATAPGRAQCLVRALWRKTLLLGRVTPTFGAE